MYRPPVKGWELLLYLVFGAVSAYLVIGGLAVLFDPSITHVGSMHGPVAIGDNGNRFVISMMELGVGVVGVVSLPSPVRGEG